MAGRMVARGCGRLRGSSGRLRHVLMQDLSLSSLNQVAFFHFLFFLLFA